MFFHEVVLSTYLYINLMTMSDIDMTYERSSKKKKIKAAAKRKYNKKDLNHFR